jgi:hypothetical protein
MFLSIHDLVQFTGGHLRLAAMPHVDGAWVQVPRIVFDSQLVERGDLFWQVDPHDCDTQLAYLRGAIGVVTDGRQVEPWPGTFCLLVTDAVRSLEQLVEALQSGQAAEIPGRFLPEEVGDELPDEAIAGRISPASETASPAAEESFQETPELKILQLSGKRGVANFPPTCGQLAARCRRRAA